MLTLSLINFIKALERKKIYKSHMRYISVSKEEFNEGKEIIKTFHLCVTFSKRKKK